MLLVMSLPEILLRLSPVRLRSRSATVAVAIVSFVVLVFLAFGSQWYHDKWPFVALMAAWWLMTLLFGRTRGVVGWGLLLTGTVLGTSWAFFGRLPSEGPGLACVLMVFASESGGRRRGSMTGPSKVEDAASR